MVCEQRLLKGEGPRTGWSRELTNDGELILVSGVGGGVKCGVGGGTVAGCVVGNSWNRAVTAAPYCRP